MVQSREVPIPDCSRSDNTGPLSELSGNSPILLSKVCDLVIKSVTQNYGAFYRRK